LIEEVGMKRHMKSFTVVKKGTASEKAELKAWLLRRTVFAQAVSNEAVRAGIQRRGDSSGRSA
jgi:hypothetical protein